MKQKRKIRQTKRDIQVIIYPKIGRKIGRSTDRKKKADVSSSNRRFLESL